LIVSPKGFTKFPRQISAYIAVGISNIIPSIAQMTPRKNIFFRVINAHTFPLLFLWFTCKHLSPVMLQGQSYFNIVIYIMSNKIIYVL
jgi:hypothetical protein